MSFSGAKSGARLTSDIESASRAKAPLMTPQLQQHARASGWSEAAIKHLYVEYENGGYHPRYKTEGRIPVEAEEFGSPTMRAKPAMRTWALHSHVYASGMHDQAMKDAILGELF